MKGCLSLKCHTTIPLVTFHHTNTHYKISSNTILPFKMLTLMKRSRDFGGKLMFLYPWVYFKDTHLAKEKSRANNLTMLYLTPSISLLLNSIKLVFHLISDTHHGLISNSHHNRHSQRLRQFPQFISLI